MADSLRIAILSLNYAPEPSGIAPYAAGLAVGLRETGHRVRVITARPHYPAWTVTEGFGGWRRRTVEDGVHVTRVRHYIPRHPSMLRRFCSELSFGLRLAFERWGRPDVIVLTSPALFSSAIAAARARWRPHPIPVVLWVQDLYGIGITETGHGDRFAARFASRVESALMRSANRVVVIHERFRQLLAERLGVPADHIEVVPNWSHVDPVDASRRADLRRQRGWGDDETVVLHAGNIGAKQGLGSVVEAARLADERQAPVRFVLLGDGSVAEKLAEAGAGLERLEFVGILPDDEFAHFLTAADVLLVNERPGVREMAVPSKLTTYFGAGLPVIAATEADSITEAEIEAAGAGIRVEPGDPEALLAGVLLLRADPERRAELGAAGLRYRAEVLSAAPAISRYARVLERSVSEAPPRRR